MKFRMFLGQLNLEMKLFLRDRQVVFWTFFFPVFLILLFGFIFGKPDSIKFNVGVVDEDQSEQSKQIVSALEAISVLKVEKGTKESMLKKLKENDKNIAVTAFPSFSSQLLSSFPLLTWSEPFAPFSTTASASPMSSRRWVS